MNQKTQAWLLVAATAAVGGFLSGAGQFLMDSAAHGFAGLGWKQVAAGAVGAGMMGVSAWWHRFSPAPTNGDGK